MEKTITFSNPMWVLARWIGILPASILGCIIVGALLNLLFWMLNPWDGYFSMRSIIMNLIRDGLVGYSFVYIGTFVAPTSKKIVGVVLLVIFTFLSSVIIIQALQIQYGYKFAEGIAGIIGAVVCFVTLSEELKNKK
ncbi:MAG: hypothetical protein ACKO7P_16100 [Bacteroidota bacterium]